MVELRDRLLADCGAHRLRSPPLEFPFKFEAPLEQREENRLAIINAWRKAHGLPLMPQPKYPKVAAVPADRLEPLLDRLQIASADETGAASAAIEQLGPGALQGTLKRLKSLKDGSPQRTSLEQLALRLATTIVEIEYADKSTKPDAELQAKLQSLKGKPVDPTVMSAAVISIGKNLKRSAPGVCITLVHPAKQAGTTLHVDVYDKTRAAGIPVAGRIAPDDSSPKDRPYVWGEEYSARIDGKSVANSSSIGRLDSNELHRIFAPVTSTPIDKSLEIRIQLIGIWQRR